MEEDYVAILKPFCRFTQGPKQTKAIACLPDVGNGSHYVLVSYLADLIRNYLCIYSTQAVDTAKLVADLQKHHAEFEA